MAMDRRVFLVLLLAGCADTSPQGPLTAVAPPPPPQPTPAKPAAPPPSPDTPVPAGELAFDTWMKDFRVRALAAGLSPALLDRELSGVTPDPKVISLDSRQPEFSKPVGDYIRGVISDDRIAVGRRKREELTFLPAIEARYGVPRDILLAVWAMESAFGQLQGNFDVIRSMVSLAADGRRRAWAEGELIAALKIIDSGEVSRAQLRGSWAGAMGQTQFIPSSYRSTAVDFDGDGRRDIWSSDADSLASAANLLMKGGWKPGVGWAKEVLLPAGFDYSVTEVEKQPPAWWEARGVRRADGLAWTAADAASPAMLILPAGATGPAFLALPNHFAIRAYNNSTAYALGIGLLADRFGGGGPLVTPWPVETPLNLADRMAAQIALSRLGFDPGPADGVIGVGTRKALRAWQQSQQLPADGYLSADMVARLKARAGISP
ncbi:MULTISPECIES: lytic murein transglycosylase [Caulobacter]|jgi:lytic murein transglycosylase|uniref:Lytic murein transglycosylase n=1 Tax=Caulobacter vibrioides OR37 TaxID=1292034 RepID=R0D494_CAUVI|nr:MULTISPECIES: lytic murein transglycosylase [Caulobacter]ENZ83200.1 lytic murein transglycosylase [Caulobacter vibrioides OR37]MBQ1561905.1 lytic murein transglycosylase [Caulobacter sp.]